MDPANLSSADPMLQLGVGGVFVVMVLRLVFEFLKSRKNGGGEANLELLTDVKDLLTGQQEQLREIRARVDGLQDHVYDMYRWHDVNDPSFPGSKLWWGVGVAELLRRQADVLQALKALLERSNDKPKARNDQD